MAAGFLERLGVVAGATLRAAFHRWSAVGLVLAAMLYPLLVAGIAAAHVPNLDDLATAESLYSALFLPVILLLVCLVLGVGLFRRELEEDTLLYPFNRSFPRTGLLLGKYLGFVAAAGIVLVPSAVIGTAIAAAAGPSAIPLTPGLSEALFLVTMLAIVTYGAFFLLLGLLTRYAMVIGLLYGFVWETFISLIPGPIQELTVIYYLRTVAAGLTTSGPLAGGPTLFGVDAATLGLIGSALVSLAFGAAFLRYAEIRPSAAPA